MSRIIQNSDHHEEAKPYTMGTINYDLAPQISQEDLPSDPTGGAQVADNPMSAEEEGYQRGYESGERAGKEAAAIEDGKVINGIYNLLEGLKNLNRQMYEEGETKIVALAICIAEKVIHSEVKQNHEVVVNVVRAALKKVLDREMLKIKVNPKDFDILNRYRPEFIASTNGKKGLTIEWEDSIAPGGCLIETNHGEVDARLDKQLEEISIELKEEMERDGPRNEDR